MKVSAGKVDNFITNPSGDVIAILIYGPDIGLVSQRAKLLASWAVDDINDPFNVVEIPKDRLKSNPSIVNDEMASISLMGGRRLIFLKDADNTNTNHLKSALEQDLNQEDAILIVTAGDLKPGSLRKLFEGAKNAAALPCYRDDILGLSKIVSAKLRKENYSFDQDVISYIAVNCQGDRLIVESEITKLLLYIGDKNYITLDDVKASIGQTTESNFDDICNSIAMGNHNLLQHHLRKSLLQGILPISLMRAVQRFFNRIHHVQGLINQGQTQDEAIKKLYPPIFFKQVPVFKQALIKWSGNRSRLLWKVLAELYQAELECKQSGSNPELICSRYLMKITSLCK